jgi:hypothetical protein
MIGRAGPAAPKVMVTSLKIPVKERGSQSLRTIPWPEAAAPFLLTIMAVSRKLIKLLSNPTHEGVAKKGA